MMLKKWHVFISYRSSCFANVTLQPLIFESKIIFDDKFDHSSILSNTVFGSSPPEVFLGKGVLKICSKFTGEHLCQSVI